MGQWGPNRQVGVGAASPGHTWGPYGCCNNGEASSFLCGLFVLCASNWSPSPKWSGKKNSNYTPISFMLWFSNMFTNVPGPLIIDWPIDTNHNWEEHAIIQLHSSNFWRAFWMCLSFVQHTTPVIKLLLWKVVCSCMYVSTFCSFTMLSVSLWEKVWVVL